MFYNEYIFGGHPEGGVHIMDYKQLIVELLDFINDSDSLELLYELSKRLATSES